MESEALYTLAFRFSIEFEDRPLCGNLYPYAQLMVGQFHIRAVGSGVNGFPQQTLAELPVQVFLQGERKQISLTKLLHHIDRYDEEQDRLESSHHDISAIHEFHQGRIVGDEGETIPLCLNGLLHFNYIGDSPSRPSSVS